jgi:NAD(P)-dependent dehydrogenase (short-subunit alcohol dehydrogenase family)
VDLGLKDASAVAVGGSRRMGRAAAQCFADDGARVAVIARSAADLDRTVEDLIRRGSPDAVGLVADAADEQQIAAAFDTLAQRWGAPDPHRLMEAITTHFGHPAHLPRAGLPSEIGPVVAFLASRRNSYMTGANVNVDGGSDFT